MNSTSDYSQTSRSENTTDIHEASMKSSTKHVDDTMKPTQVVPIPPEGRVMVDCKANPLTITIDIGPQDSVATKLKQISTLAYDYTNTPKLAQDFLRADSVSVDYEKHGNGPGIKQISAEILNPSEVDNNSGHCGADNELNSSTAAVINTTSSHHTDFTTDQDSLSEDDLLGINNGKTPVDDLDPDEENRLLQTSSLMEIKSTYPQLPSSNRKQKTVTDDDESSNEIDKKKKKIKTLGVKLKKTSGRANFGKSARLPAFSRLSRSIICKKGTAMSSDSTPSSLSSEESDEESAPEGNNSESHITISDENQSDVKPKLKGAIKLKPKVDPDKDDEDPKLKSDIKN